MAKVTNKGGRNNSGRMTVRHQGGGHKRRYRLIDFKRIKDNILAKVATASNTIRTSSANTALRSTDGGGNIYRLNGLKLQMPFAVELISKSGNALPPRISSVHRTQR